MIQLNVDFSLLNRFFGLSVTQIAQYRCKDLQEILEIEASNGNKKAQNYREVLSDPDKLIDIFKLANAQNRYLILQSMSEGDLDKLLPYLTQEQLAMGLNFFTDEKLIELSQQLPIEELAIMIFDNFSPMKVLSFMQEDAMDKIISNPDVERKYAEEYLFSLDQKSLEKIMTSVYGEEMKGKTIPEYIDYMKELKDGEFKRFLLGFEKEDKMNLIAGMMKIEPDLLTLFDPKDMTRPMEMIQKQDKVEMMEKLDPEFLIPMMQQLPINLTQILVTQINPKDFSEILAKDFDDILSQVVLFT